jgi:hypothetical protein
MTIEMASTVPDVVEMVAPGPTRLGRRRSERPASTRYRRGDEGTTIVKRSVQTATHESPIHVAFRKSRLCGWSSSAAAMP